MGVSIDSYLFFGVKVELEERNITDEYRDNEPTRFLPNGREADNINFKGVYDASIVLSKEEGDIVKKNPKSILERKIQIYYPDEVFDDPHSYIGIPISATHNSSEEVIKPIDPDLMRILMEGRARVAQRINESGGFNFKPEDIELYHILDVSDFLEQYG